MNKLYQYHYSGTLDKLKSIVKNEKFTAILERIESVEIKKGISLDDPFNDFLKVRLFNEKYDITVTSSATLNINAVILTEENINGMDKVEYTIVEVKDITNFIRENPVGVKKYICKRIGDNSIQIAEKIWLINEKQVFYRLNRLIGD